MTTKIPQTLDEVNNRVSLTTIKKAVDNLVDESKPNPFKTIMEKVSFYQTASQAYKQAKTAKDKDDSLVTGKEYMLHLRLQIEKDYMITGDATGAGLDALFEQPQHPDLRDHCWLVALEKGISQIDEWNNKVHRLETLVQELQEEIQCYKMVGELENKHRAFLRGVEQGRSESQNEIDQLKQQKEMLRQEVQFLVELQVELNSAPDTSEVTKNEES